MYSFLRHAWRASWWASLQVFLALWPYYPLALRPCSGSLTFRLLPYQDFRIDLAISLRLPPFDFIIAYWLRTRLRIVQQSDLRGSLRVACPCNLAVPSFDFMGFPRGDRPSRVLGSARRLGKQRTYRRTGRCCRPEDGSPERLTLYFPRSPLQTW